MKKHPVLLIIIQMLVIIMIIIIKVNYIALTVSK